MKERCGGRESERRKVSGKQETKKCERMSEVERVEGRRKEKGGRRRKRRRKDRRKAKENARGEGRVERRPRRKTRAGGKGKREEKGEEKEEKKQGGRRAYKYKTTKGKGRLTEENG